MPAPLTLDPDHATRVIEHYSHVLRVMRGVVPAPALYVLAYLWLHCEPHDSTPTVERAHLRHTRLVPSAIGAALDELAQVGAIDVSNNTHLRLLRPSADELFASTLGFDDDDDDDDQSSETTAQVAADAEAH